MLEINLKKELYKQCNSFVNKRLQTVEEIISSNQKALQSETKSSAGDKYETSREMINQEINQIGNQIQNVRTQQGLMTKLNFDEKKQTCLGAIFGTSKSIFCWSTSAGKVKFQDEVVMCISSQSPFAQTCHDKNVGEKVGMANMETEVLWVV